MDTSTLVLTPASERLICDVVDNNCALNLSEQPRIVVAAYCAVFLPWGFLALLDMINERWKTIRRVFIQGVLQILIAIPTMGYTFYYIELQRADRDYKEMCAAIVAVCLSAFHFFRTAWGLWQTYWYWRWVRFCLRHLNRHGYPLEEIERSNMHRGEYWLRMHWSYERRLTTLSLSMKINNSVADNEFLECDIPFQINYSKLYQPHKWFSSQNLFTPRHFADSSLRYMIPFVAQFGRKWLRDCDQAKAVLENHKVHYESAFVMRYAVRHSKMLTEQDSNEWDEERATNWSNMWLNILSCHAERKLHIFKSKPRMPFGGNEGYIFMGKYAAYKSKINRLIDNLSQELFEVDQIEPDKGDVVQRISAFHLESFIVFLNSEVGNQVREGSLENEPTDSRETSRAQEPEADTLATPDTHSHSESSIPDLEASSTNSAVVITEEGYEFEEQICETEAEREGSGIESNIHPHMVGNIHRRQLEFCRDPPKQIHSDTFFSEWSLERLAREKLQRSRVRYNHWVREFSSTRQVEFTIHLENLFSLGQHNREYFDGRISPASVADREAYYAELCGRNRTIRKLAAFEKVKPRCDTQLQFWRLWNLPECLPFATRDIHLATDGKSGGIRFIGYVMETVRDCLAKWTSQHVNENLESSTWSPELRTDAAYVEFESSNEFVKDVLNYTAGSVPGYFEKWIGAEQVIWEFQNHILGLIDNDESEYGPCSVELMLLCMLGLPILQVSRITHGKKFRGFRVDFDKVYQKPLAIHINFNRDAGEHGKLRFSITPLVEGNGFRFEWAKWIHSFESGMRVLTYEYEEDDLLCLPATATDTNVDDVATDIRSTAVDGEGDESIESNVIGGDWAAMDSVAVMGHDTNGVFSEGTDEDVVTASAGCSCGCKYKLNTKAKRVFIEDREGAEKFFWEWEGWRPQQAFEEDRFPILHVVQAAEERQGRGDQEGREEHGMGIDEHSLPRGGSKVGDNTAPSEVAFSDTDEQV